MLRRNLTIATANIGRKVPIAEFEENVMRLDRQVPGAHRFFGFQEIDEADAPEELKFLKSVFGKTHRFVGQKTRVPIAVPRTFEVRRPVITFASPGVAELSPHRHHVQAVVSPVDKANAKIVASNTHFGRNVPELKDERAQAAATVEERLKYWQEKGLPSWLTGDLNSKNFRKLGDNEQRWVTQGLDYIRGYDVAGVRMKLLSAGTVDLTIDGHNAHWARVEVTWPGA